MTKVRILITVDDDYADATHAMGLTEEGYLRLTDALTDSVAADVIDVRRARADD